MTTQCPICHSDNPETSRFCADCGSQLITVDDISVSLTETILAPKEELPTGSIFAGRYQIIEQLGKGGMGRVYRVLDKKLNEEIALKLIKPEISLDKKTVERFSHELKTARKISHKNVARMFDLNEEDGTHYITMEYVRGEDLKRLIRKMGQFSAGQAVPIAKQICEGLAEAHRLGIIHRDLKPQNIMVDEDGNTRIMDFGIARSRESKELTGTGVIIGTPKYMPPEQVEGKEIDQRSDIYSLGIILYEMVTGRVPFEGDTLLSIAHKQKYEPPVEPNQINTQISDDLNRLILKCLEKDKEKRFQNADELCSELLSLEKEIPAAERTFPEKKPSTSREITVTFALKKLRFPAIIAVTFIFIAVILWQVLKHGKAGISLETMPSIAVITFENQTGDEAYDRLRKIIPNLLITSLEQSGNFYVVTWERMYDLLKQVGREDTEVITRDLGFELCRLDNIDYIVLGSVTKLGDVFATDVKILGVQSKELLRSASARGESEASILESQIDELSKEITQGIGVSERKMKAVSRRIVDVTTNSMDAYNAFLKGVEKYDRYYYEEARQFLEQAINIDPNFAVAYEWLALVYGKLGDSNATTEALKKAKALAAKTNEKDRLNIEALYAQLIEKDVEKRIRILKEIARKYPREKRVHYNLGIHYWNNKEFSEAIDEYSKALALDPNFGSALNGLGYTYADMGNYEKAIESFEKYAAVSPGDANPLDSMAEIYFQIGKLDDSINKYRAAIEAQSDYFEAYWRMAYVYALKEDYPKALSWIEQLIDRAPSPGIIAEAYLWKSFYHYWTGNLDQSLRALGVASQQAESVGNNFGQAFSAWIDGWIHYDKGDMETFRSQMEQWLDLMKKHPHSYRPAPSPEFYSAEYNYFLGLGDINEERLESAESRLREMDSLMPKIDPVFKSRVALSDFKVFDGEVLLANGSLEKAISVFKEESLLEVPYMHSWLILLYNTPFPRDVLARIYLKNGDLDRAITEYERLIIFHPESQERRLIHPLCYYRLAKLYEKRDLRSKAIKNYEKFLELWKDADAGIDEIADAKERLVGLKNE